MPTHVLVHGYAVDAPSWEQVLWGDPVDGLGRVPRGLLTAFARRADLLTLGSCVAHAEMTPYHPTFRAVFFERLFDFSAHAAYAGVDMQALAFWADGHLALDKTSFNTAQETAAAATRLMLAGGGTLIVVSSPFHVSRCLRDALIWRDANNVSPANMAVEAVAADTNPPGITPAEVVVFEPAHRLAPGQVSLQPLAQGLMRVPADRRAAVFDAVQEVLHRFAPGS